MTLPVIEECNFMKDIILLIMKENFHCKYTYSYQV